jgi:hypothetical protein
MDDGDEVDISRRHVTSRFIDEMLLVLGSVAFSSHNIKCNSDRRVLHLKREVVLVVRQTSDELQPRKAGEGGLDVLKYLLELQLMILGTQFCHTANDVLSNKPEAAEQWLCTSAAKFNTSHLVA